MGVLVNFAAIIAGGLLGNFAHKLIPSHVSDALMSGCALCVCIIGISGALGGQNTLIMVLSIVIGGAIGTLLRIQDNITKLGSKLEERFAKNSEGLAKGFVSGTLLFCIGAMAVVGSINSGLTGDNEILYTKSLLDFITSTALASTLGVGVALSGVSVFLYQGAIYLLAGVIEPLLTEYPRGELVCAGSVIILGLGLNMLGAIKIKVADYLPAILIAPLLCLFM